MNDYRFLLSHSVAADRAKSVATASSRLLHPLVYEELAAQNRGRGSEVDRSIEILSEPGTVVVVAGQQLGFGGGPLLTLYKALHAIVAARELSRETGASVVPVFWLQGEDHDYEEVKGGLIVGPGEGYVPLELTIDAERIGGPVGSITPTNDEVTRFRESLDQLLEHESFASLKAQLYQAYSSSLSLAQSFSSIIGPIVAPYGMVLFDCHRPIIKQVATELIAATFTRRNTIASALVAKVEALTGRGFAAPVRVRPNAPLFFLSDAQGRRERLTEREDGVFIGAGGSYSLAELLTLVEKTPERFTTSALIRPILQDYLLPTAASIAGVAERSYWAQCAPLYELFGIAQPLVVPRQRFAIFTPALARIRERTGLSLEDLSQDETSLLARRFAGSLYDPEPLFEAIDRESLSVLMARRDLFEEVDPQLVEALSLTHESNARNIKKLRGRYERALSQRAETEGQRVSRLRGFVFPGGQPQERVVLYLPLVQAYGPSFVERICDAIDPFGEGDEREIVL